MLRAPITYWFPGCLEIPDTYAGRFSARKYFARGDGPEKDRSGLLVAGWACDAVRYEPALQRWDQIAPDCWIGVLRGTPPETFRRASPRPGYMVTMADGQKWLVPVANPFAATCCLPRWDVLGPNGWTSVVQDRFEALASRAAEAAAKMRTALLEGTAEIGLDEDWLRQLAADAIAVNYDLTIAECSALRLFSADCLADAVRALIDWPEIERVLRLEIEQARGRESSGPPPFGDGAPTAGSDTPPGAEGSSLTIPLPASTCS
jgi:hypothetical protein